MFDLMQYALIFYDFQLILAQMGLWALCLGHIIHGGQGCPLSPKPYIP